MRFLAVAILAVSCLSAVHSAAVETGSDSSVTEAQHALQSSPNLERMVKKTYSFLKGRSFFRTMGEEIMNYLGFGGEEYDDYDEHEYFYPSFDSGVIGQGLGSSYSFYNPYGDHPARDDNFEEESSYGWGDFMFDAAVVAVPMALALAAMPTGIFTIPVVGRSIDNNIEDSLKPYELPILKAVEKADFLSYTTRECQERVFCEIAQVGRHRDSSMMQKIAYFIANLTPDSYADTYGVAKLFKSARDGHCESFKCVPLMAQTKAAIGQ